MGTLARLLPLLLLPLLMLVYSTKADLSQRSWESRSVCKDETVNCADYKSRCGKFTFMEVLCPKTCGICPKICKDETVNCADYKSRCGKFTFMEVLCPKTCGICPKNPITFTTPIATTESTTDAAATTTTTTTTSTTTTTTTTATTTATSTTEPITTTMSTLEPSSPPPTTTTTTTTSRPFGWQPPEICHNYGRNSKIDNSNLEKEKEFNFSPGLPFSEEEIKTALLNETIPDIPPEIQCSSEFPQDVPSSRNVVNPNWPNAAIPYEIDSIFSVDQRQMIIKAMEEIQSKTCIRFPARDVDDLYSFWLQIRPHHKRCRASHKGHPSWGLPHITPANIWLAPHCFSQGTIVHELLHIAGLGHEHCRKDRDDYVTIHWENIKEEPDHIAKKQFCKDPTMDTGFPYDFDSVMHYGEYQGSGNDLKTIVAHNHTGVFGRVREMSQGDVDQLNHIYCKKQVCESGWKSIDSSERRYCFIDNRFSWYNTHAYCQSFGLGAHLPILDTELKRTNMLDYMNTNGIQWAWVGATSSGDGFYWENGNPVKNYGWDAPLAKPGENLCLIARTPGSWYTLNCNYYNYLIHIICEK